MEAKAMLRAPALTVYAIKVLVFPVHAIIVGAVLGQDLYRWWNIFSTAKLDKYYKLRSPFRLIDLSSIKRINLLSSI